MINRAAATKANADLVGQAIDQAAVQRAASRLLPDQPSECGHYVRSGVEASDRQDVAIVKTDVALGRANARGAACARWYLDLKKGWSSAEAPRPH